MKYLISALLLFCFISVKAQSSSSTLYTKQELIEAMTANRDIRFWTYLHREGNVNKAVKGISLDSLFTVLDSLGLTGGGGGTVIAYYQTAQNNGTSLPQRNSINFKSGNPNLTVVAADNSGSSRTDVTITAPGGTVTSSSDEIVVISGTGAALKPFSVQFVPDNVDLEEFAGQLSLLRLGQDGASNGMVPIWTPAGWVPGFVSANGNYVAGEGISISGNLVTNTGDFNAADDVLVTSEFDGDVSGTYDSITINPGAITGAKIAQMGATTNQVLKWNGTTWIPSNDAGGTTYGAGSGISIVGNLISAADISNTNEIQNLSLSGQTLNISSGTSVTLPLVGATAGTGIGVSVTGGVATVTNTGDLSATNELQTISTSGAAGNITLSNSGGTLTLNVNDADADVTNEIQTLSASANSISISGGNSVTADTDPSDDLTTSTTFAGEVAGTYNNLSVIKWKRKTVTAGIGATTLTVSGTQPGTLDKVRIERNGLSQIVGVHVTYSGGVYSFSRPTASGETWTVYFQEF